MGSTVMAICFEMRVHLKTLCACRVTAKGNYTEKDAADLITQLLEGVSYLHSQGLCPP